MADHAPPQRPRLVPGRLERRPAQRDPAPPRHRPVLTALVAAAALAAPSIGCAASHSSTAREADRGVVAGHVDGDTIDIAVGDRVERVRLIGIDTPESATRDRPAECFADRASAHLASIAPTGAPVRLERDVVPRDDYGRLLAYAYLPDETMINLALVEAGMARPLTIEPNDAHASSFVAAAHGAERAGLGLWSACRRRARHRGCGRSPQPMAVA